MFAGSVSLALVQVEYASWLQVATINDPRPDLQTRAPRSLTAARACARLAKSRLALAAETWGNSGEL